MIIAQPCEYTENYWIVHFEWVSFSVYESYLNEAFVFRKAVERCQLINEVNANENKSPNSLPYTFHLFRLSQQWLTAWIPAARPHRPCSLSSPLPHILMSLMDEKENQNTPFLSAGEFEKGQGDWTEHERSFSQSTRQMNHSFWGLGREPEWQSEFLPMERPRVRNKSVPSSLHLLVFASSNVLKNSNLSIIS